MVKEVCKNEEVILLQETNWKNEVMDDFKKRWNGEMFYKQWRWKNGKRSGYSNKGRCGF